MEIDIENLVREHGDYLFSFAMSRVRDQEVAQDLLQEALVVAVKNAKAFRGDSQPRVWLAGILKNKIYEHYRKEAKKNKLMAADDISDLGHKLEEARHWFDEIAPKGTSDPARELERKELMQAIGTCIDALPEKNGQVFSFYMIERMKPEEIRNILGISATNLRVMMQSRPIQAARMSRKGLV